MSPSICVQIIHTTWSKASRGGVGAQRRSAIPLAFPLELMGAGSFSVEIRRFYEINNFDCAAPSCHNSELESSLEYIWKSFVLLWDGQKTTARFKWSEWDAGAPKMTVFDEAGNERPYQRDLIVPPDEWVRVRWMGRFSDVDEGSWWYEHTVVNVACLDEKPRHDIFLETKPAKEFVRLPHLR